MYSASLAAPARGMALYSEARMPPAVLWPLTETKPRAAAPAAKRGLVSVKGHKVTGGMRASLYNAMPLEGAEKLADYMREFERNHV